MRRLAFIMPVVIALVACAAGAAGPGTDAGHAEALYTTNCAGCHDNGATGAPNRLALQARTPAAILAALTTGLMREQGKALTPAERTLVAEHLGTRRTAAIGPKCARNPVGPGAILWNRWGNGLDNRRFQSAASGGLSGRNAADLELKWAFAFPGAARARSQPAVTSDTIYTGSPDGRVLALDLATGCIRWTFEADSEVRGAPTLGAGPSGKADRLYFGDFAANLYAVEARTGKLVWKHSVRDHPAGTITGSPTLFAGRLYVPMSSTEVVSAMNGDYGCCTFRGGIVAVEAKDGTPVWRMYTTAEPVEAGTNSRGVTRFGPSGAPVWSPPTVDAKRGLLYIGSGENYSSPAGGMSDAILALELATGKVRWVRQVLGGDAWNASCGGIGNGINCPQEDGPDLDFGAPPILATLANGTDIVLAGQKSGRVFGIDPDSGTILWEQRAGAGGFNGGVHWGMASDGRTLFVGISDTPGNKGAVGPRRPGLHAFDAATGKPLWSRIEPFTCPERKFECETALSAPVTLTEGVVFAGAHNGLLRAFASDDGRLLWSFDTRRDVPTVNGVKGRGGSIDSAGPVVAGGRLIVNSGYDKFGEIPGNVLMVFAPRGAK